MNDLQRGWGKTPPSGPTRPDSLASPRSPSSTHTNKEQEPPTRKWLPRTGSDWTRTPLGAAPYSRFPAQRDPHQEWPALAETEPRRSIPFHRTQAGRHPEEGDQRDLEAPVTPLEPSSPLLSADVFEAATLPWLPARAPCPSVSARLQDSLLRRALARALAAPSAPGTSLGATAGGDAIEALELLPPPRACLGAPAQSVRPARRVLDNPGPLEPDSRRPDDHPNRCALRGSRDRCSLWSALAALLVGFVVGWALSGIHDSGRLFPWGTSQGSAPCRDRPSSTLGSSARALPE